MARPDIIIAESPTSSTPRSLSPFRDSSEHGDLTIEELESGNAWEVRRAPGWRAWIMAIRRRLSPSRRTSIEPTHLVVGGEKRRGKTARFWCSRLCVGIPVFTLLIFGVIHVIEALAGYGSSMWDREYDDFLPEYGRPGHLGEGLAEYPTDFTRDVIPIACHSHNDYWRRVPLYQAIHFGCIGVEADVWLFDEELFVGHSTISLTRNRTFRSLYVDPLVEILGRQNPHTEFSSNDTRNGVFDEAPEQSLVLLVDYKTSGEAIHPYVMKQLEPLREKGLLSYWDGDKVHSRPITVVGTGNAPFNLLTANSTYRDVFFDAPLASLSDTPKHKKREAGQGHSGLPADVAFSPANSYFASVSFTSAVGFLFTGRLSKRQKNIIRTQIKEAHDRGLKVRYWDTPSWPIGVRNHVWTELVKEGVDYLNADDLKSASRLDWSKRKDYWI